MTEPSTQIQSQSWSKPEHVPGPVCWLKQRLAECLILHVCYDGVMAASHGIGGEQLRPILIKYGNFSLWQYSTDRINWRPCTVPAAAEEAPAWYEPCPEWVMWQATDATGDMWGYKLKPATSQDWWRPHDEDKQQPTILKKKGPPLPANWRETLVVRPQPKEVKTCATSAAPEVVPNADKPLEPATQPDAVASPAPQQSNPADRGAEPAQQDDAADREWALREWDKWFRGSTCISVADLLLAAIARGRAQSRAGAGAGEGRKP